MYGHDSVFMRYIMVFPYENPAKHITVEHGNILVDCTAPQNIDRYQDKLVLTYREERITYFNEVGVKAKAIGPYIHYAKNRVSKEIFKSIKQELGRVVLFFPHFSEKWNNEHTLCINMLLSWKNEGKVDSIVVCYRLDDVSKGADFINMYNKIGAIPACCGDMRNPFYMDHLKFLIELSDFTASNVVSTPVGYSLYMKKQHFIIGDYKSRFNKNNPTDQKTIYLFEKLYRNLPEIYNIEDEVVNKVSKWWGFDAVLSEKEFKKILLDS